MLDEPQANTHTHMFSLSHAILPLSLTHTHTHTHAHILSVIFAEVEDAPQQETAAPPSESSGARDKARPDGEGELRSMART